MKKLLIFSIIMLFAVQLFAVDVTVPSFRTHDWNDEPLTKAHYRETIVDTIANVSFNADDTELLYIIDINKPGLKYFVTDMSWDMGGFGSENDSVYVNVFMASTDSEDESYSDNPGITIYKTGVDVTNNATYVIRAAGDLIEGTYLYIYVSSECDSGIDGFDIYNVISTITLW